MNDEVQSLICTIQGIKVGNASANTTLVEYFGEVLNHEDIRELNFRCLSHVLNLGVEDILKNFDVGFTNIRDEEGPVSFILITTWKTILPNWLQSVK